MTTIAQLIFGLDGQAKFDGMAARSGMTAEQAAAACMLQSLAHMITAEHKAVLADQTKALPILTKIAAMPAGDDALERFDRVVAAILTNQS
jgi:hypothetical protein